MPSASISSSSATAVGSPVTAVSFCRLECDHKDLFQSEYKRCVGRCDPSMHRSGFFSTVRAYCCCVWICVCLRQEQPHQRAKDPAVRLNEPKMHALLQHGSLTHAFICDFI